MKNLNAYLIFNGNCRLAMEFYHKILGGVLYVSTYGDMPGLPPNFPENAKNWVIHARITIKSLVLMASDTRPDLLVTQGNNFFVSLNAENIPEAEKLFNALKEKGTVEMPLQETEWAHRFGMLTDQFGIKWMINFEKEKVV